MLRAGDRWCHCGRCDEWLRGRFSSPHGLLSLHFADDDRVQLLELGQSLDDFQPPLLFGESFVHGVADEQQLLERGQIAQLRQLVERLDAVVAHVDQLQLAHAAEPVALLDGVVADPQLLERVGHVLQLLEALDVVATQRQNLEILQARERRDALDAVGAER